MKGQELNKNKLVELLCNYSVLVLLISFKIVKKFKKKTTKNLLLRIKNKFFLFASFKLYYHVSRKELKFSFSLLLYYSDKLHIFHRCLLFDKITIIKNYLKLQIIMMLCFCK